MATSPASTGVLDPEPTAPDTPPVKKDRTHWLYIMVIIAVVAGATIGLVAPDLGKALKPLGTGFVALIKMIIAPANIVRTLSVDPPGSCRIWIWEKMKGLRINGSRAFLVRCL